jgi:hypothetical protein
VVSSQTGAGPVTGADAVTGASWASRAVFWTGIVLATAVAVTALWDGARPRIPGLPSFPGLVAGVVVMWLIVAGLGAWAAGLLRRHHRALARSAARHGKRAAVGTVRGTRKHGGRLAGRVSEWAAPRWQGRQAGDAGPRWIFRRGHDSASDQARTGDGAAVTVPAPHPRTSAPSPPGPRLNDAQRQRDTDGQQDICAACGHPGTPGDPLVIAGGYRVHRWHVTDPEDGFHDPAGAPAPAVTSGNGDPPMTTPSVPDAGTKTGAPPGAGAPAGWTALAAATADCEPEDDGELLGWMAGEVAGMAAYGESLIEVYETCVNSVGLDPVAMAAVHDVADAAADAATAMAYARQKFASHYAEVREFVGNGGVLPFDGRWITGEGDT